MRSAPGMGLDFAPRSPWRRMTLALFTVGVAGSIFALWQRHSLLAQREIAMASIDAQQRSAPRAQLSRQTVARPDYCNGQFKKSNADSSRDR